MPAHRTRARDKGVTAGEHRAEEVLTTAHATVQLEAGPAGVLARVAHARRDGTEYAGPLPAGTVAALRELAERGEGAT
ncbi:hypothetical protein ACOJIV_25035 [Haloarcula sp. AONF1]